MAIFSKKENQSSSFYESFSDLLFCTLVLFLIIIVGLIFQINEETEKMNGRQKYLAMKIEEAEKKIKEAEDRQEKLDLANVKLGSEKERLEKWTAQLEKDAQNINDAIGKATEEYKEVIRGMEVAAGEARKREQKARKAFGDFLGLNGEMKNVVILLDLSGSMTNKPEYARKFVELKDLISELVTTLPFEKFNVIGFDNNTKGQVRLVPVSNTTTSWLAASDSNRKMASGKIKKWQAQGGTPTKEAIECAFRHKDVDTIVLYSDGEPNGGAEDVLNHVRSLNTSKKVVLNTISVGKFATQSSFLEFMKKLAAENNGRSRAF